MTTSTLQQLRWLSTRSFHSTTPRGLFIQTESTPNDQALKFKPGKRILPSDQVYEFTSYSSTSISPLARALFQQVPSIKSVFFGLDFVTIQKRGGDDEVDWSVLKPDIYAILMDYLATDDHPPIVVMDGEELERLRLHQASLDDGGKPEVVEMIVELLDTRIRPAVAEDGGDVEFMGFSADGVVKLMLKGSCRGCSSSSITLKNGIENMMKHYIPEVVSVEQVLDEAEEVALKEFNKLEDTLSKKNGGDK